MVMAGLLWYDDDNRRPVAAKVIEAVERYRERVGFEPTVCQLAPAQLTALAAATASRSKRAHTPAIELPRALRLEPDEHLHPNYFMLGVGEGDIAIRVTMQDDEIPRRTRRTTQAHTTYASRQPARRRPAPYRWLKQQPLNPANPVSTHWLRWPPVVAPTSAKRRTATKPARPVTAAKKNEQVTTVATPAATNLPKAKAARPAVAKQIAVKPVAAKVVGPEKAAKTGKPAITRANGAKGVVEKSPLSQSSSRKGQQSQQGHHAASHQIGKRVATKPVATKPVATKPMLLSAPYRQPQKPPSLLCQNRRQPNQRRRSPH